MRSMRAKQPAATLSALLPKMVAGVMVIFAAASAWGQAAATATALEGAIARESEATIKAFNAGDATALGSLFLETGELVDEAGNLHAGKPAITQLFTGFFGRFPKATLEMVVDSARPVGDTLVVEEGQRRVTTTDGETAQVRYVAVRSKQGDRWPIASYREFADDPLPTPREMLQGADWIVGDWVDESPEGRTEITFRWSDDGNFLLGDYTMSAAGAGESKSTQRIGWDPVSGQVRSWTFDDDGGFTEGRWVATDEGWLVQSEASMPDGTSGSATLLITVKDADHFVIRGTDRLIGGLEEPDFEMTVARKPPPPGSTK
jgi:uncharacterized protein (TIGR02246 family)